jgi:hypothetical protein
MRAMHQRGADCHQQGNTGTQRAIKHALMRDRHQNKHRHRLSVTFFQHGSIKKAMRLSALKKFTADFITFFDAASEPFFQSK